MRRILAQALILLMLALLPAAVSGMWHPRRPAWTPVVAGKGEVLLRAARGWGDVVWVDARSAERYLLDRIPGALPLSEQQWDNTFPALRAAAAEKRIIIYCDQTCDAGNVLVERVRRELPAGSEVFVLKGGFAAWKQAMQ